jgi:hypothetical protein
MKKRSKIASIVLFLAALVVGLDAQLGWCAFGTLATGYAQCDFPSMVMGAGMVGMAVLPDGRLLVATAPGVAYYPALSPVGTTCPTVQPTWVNTADYVLALTVGLDGKIYAFKQSGPYPYIYDLVTVNPNTGVVTNVGPSTNNVDGLGLTLDPLSGDLFMTHRSASTTVSRILHLYDHQQPTIVFFGSAQGVLFDGLAWSCDGTTLLVASIYNNIVKFTRAGGPGSLLVTLPGGLPGGPDGIVFGASGTPLAGYAFSNNNNGSMYAIPLSNPNNFTPIATGGSGYGDWVSVDGQGNLLVIQEPHLTRISTSTDPNSPLFGGQWVLPGSSLCGDLGCGAKAATTTQFGIPSPAAPHPCLSGLNAELLVTLSQSACVDCASCATLNQARATLLDLLNSLDPPRHCLDLLKSTLISLYESAPCGSNPCPCATCCTTKLSVGPCMAKTKFPFGFDPESYDPILQPFMRRGIFP